MLERWRPGAWWKLPRGMCRQRAGCNPGAAKVDGQAWWKLPRRNWRVLGVWSLANGRLGLCAGKGPPPTSSATIAQIWAPIWVQDMPAKCCPAACTFKARAEGLAQVKPAQAPSRVWCPHGRQRLRECGKGCFGLERQNLPQEVGGIINPHLALYGNIYHQNTPNVSIYIYIYHTWILWVMVYKTTYNWGGPSCIGFPWNFLGLVHVSFCGFRTSLSSICWRLYQLYPKYPQALGDVPFTNPCEFIPKRWVMFN